MKYRNEFQPVQPYIQPSAGYDLAGQQPYQPSPEERRHKAQTSLTNAQAKLAEQYSKRNGSIARTVLAIVFSFMAVISLCYFLFGETIAIVVMAFILIVGFFGWYDSLKNAQSVSLFRATLTAVADSNDRDAATDKARFSAFGAQARLQAQQLRIDASNNRQLPVEDIDDGKWGTVTEED
jgi:uncharacterized membrane protein YqjE